MFNLLTFGELLLV